MEYLPVFLDLRQRTVLVIGGGAVALRKVELLLQAQAQVRVIAPALHPRLEALRQAGQIEVQQRSFEAPDLAGMALAIAATDQALVNQAVALAGRACGVFVNVVDDLAASTCLMPAIIDRDPLLVAVGSAGTSPTLARQVRRQIEALLPGRLGALARFAGQWRAAVHAALPDPAARRRFWETILSGPLATDVLAGQESNAAMRAALDSAAEAPLAPRGEVWLIGAGPGDADLLTLRALQLLQQADVILYDRLVAPTVLARARREAERVFVGKEPGRHRVTQQRIHELLVQYARRGLKVARLKGGDPLVFGRAAEEIAVLAAAGIAVTVVPGISAALGAAAEAQIPLTARGVAQSVCFVTAMSESTETLNWQHLAAPQQTVVFYMGVAQLARIVEHLLAAGAPARRCAAVLERATLPQARCLRGTLADIATLAAQAQVAAPALLVVGDVVGLGR